ncbi:hypothetical protein [Streptomyces sp. NPDC059479]
MNDAPTNLWEEALGERLLRIGSRFARVPDHRVFATKDELAKAP